MFRLLLAAVAALSVVHPVGAQPPAQAAAGTPGAWNVDPAHSAAHFSVKHLMVSTVRGTLGKITGTIEYDGTSVQSIKADITIDVTAVTTGNDNRDADLKSPNFFDVAKYPTLTFKSKRVEPGTPGKFKLIEGPSPILKGQNGQQRVGASATTTINRRDFGLQYSRMMEAAPVVGDELQIQIDIEATKRS